jgi:hypothetical protein
MVDKQTKSTPILFPPNERGLSLDVFLSKGGPLSNSLVMKVRGFDEIKALVCFLDTPVNEMGRVIQETLNTLPFHIPGPVREVFFHNDEFFTLPDERYAPVRDYLTKAQTDPESRYRITFGQYVIPVVRGR